MAKSLIQTLMTYIPALILLILMGIRVRHIEVAYIWQHTGLASFSLGFLLLASYATARLLRMFRLPMISGYILCGIIAGPYMTGFLDLEMVGRLRLIDDLALTFIAMAAGGELHLHALKRRGCAIGINLLLQTLIIFAAVFLFIRLAAPCFELTRNFSPVQVTAFAILLGVIAIARSPSSAIAIINECRAAGVFTETVLGVTVALDVLIIIFFTIAVTIVKILQAGGGGADISTFLLLLAEITVSLGAGAALGKLIAMYIRNVGHDLTLFLLFIAAGVTKSCMALSLSMETAFHFHLNLEPLLICMSAGFTIRNFTDTGRIFMDRLERISLPIYLLFFSVSGASLDIDALRFCWPLALCLCGIRAISIFVSTWTAGVIVHDPASHNYNAWMTYVTQAGVAIGLAQLAQRTVPAIGDYLTTVVLAVITLNQIIGPITFKAALNRTGESGAAR